MTKSKILKQFDLNLPSWIEKDEVFSKEYFPSVTDRMQLIINLSHLNVQNDTGGPFAAGVFEKDTGKLISIGVNRVVSGNCSSAHAEVMALSLAQKRLQLYDLGGKGQPNYELVVNWRPCAMCFGAVLWSGIRTLTIAGSGEELEQITAFDEGPIHPDWRRELAKRNIELNENILKNDAVEVFKYFEKVGATVYNSRQDN